MCFSRLVSLSSILITLLKNDMLFWNLQVGRGVFNQGQEMKRGKCDEKTMGPMFPRLHVNDTEKGGPRAPPRNKMALYEQLSIPSQRFSHNSNMGSVVSTSASQGSGHERDVFCQGQFPPARHPSEKPHSHSSNSKTPLPSVRSNRKTEEDDFRVPVFISSNVSRGNGNFHCMLDGEKFSASNARLLGHSKKENPKQLAIRREHSCNSSFILSIDKPDGVLKQAHVPLHYEPRDDPENTFGSPVGGAALFEPVRVVDNGDSSPSTKDVTSEEQIIPNNPIGDTESSKKERVSKSLQTRNLDQGDDLSETSMVESISGMYISPDDVVGMIGEKRFWKARRAIANQQRVLAVQVFELHRLLKVQRLIAAGPQSSPDDSASLGKSVKNSCGKRLPLEYSVREAQNVSKLGKDCVRMECSAENTVEKASFSSVQNGTKAPSNYTPFSGNPVSNDSIIGPWCFNQASGQQWLIPVMTPSEGLVYKPYYSGPGVTDSVYGSTSMLGNAAYGVAASNHHYQGYFPQYVMNPAIDQTNQFTAQPQLSGDGDVPNVYTHADLQASTASSPSGRAQRNVTSPVLPLFPTSPAIEPHVSSHTATVIKVVPHNSRSATESAARIFQSIQQERKQY